MNLDRGTFEYLQPDFLTDTRLTPPIPLTCLTIDDFRAYPYTETVDGRNVLRLAPGITGVLDKTTDQSWKADWFGRVGYAEAQRVLAERCGFGSLMHGATARYDDRREYNFDATLDEVTDYLTNHAVNGPVNLYDWKQELQEDMASYIRWAQIVDYQPLAAELPVLSKKHNVASRIDAVGYLTVGSEGYYQSGKQEYQPKGTPRRVLAIIDKKSSRKDYDDPTRPLQLLFYEDAFRENFPQFAEEPVYLFNWAPRGWENEPKFAFTPRFINRKTYEIDETAKRAARKELDLCVELFHLRHSWRKSRTRIAGHYTAGQDVQPHISRESYLDLLAQELKAELPPELQ